MLIKEKRGNPRATMLAVAISSSLSCGICFGADPPQSLYRNQPDAPPVLLASEPIHGKEIRESSYQVTMDPINVLEESYSDMSWAIAAGRENRRREFEAMKSANDFEQTSEHAYARVPMYREEVGYRPYYSPTVYVGLGAYGRRHRHFGTALGVGLTFPIWAYPSSSYQ